MPLYNGMAILNLHKMEKQYRVIPIAITGSGNKIHYAGDIVTQSTLATDAGTLVKGGYIAEIVAEIAPTPVEPIKDTKPKKQNK
jgi:hypothetical protein